jgi:hypothetical protein
MVLVAAFSHVASCCVLSQGWAERRKFVALRSGPFGPWDPVHSFAFEMESRLKFVPIPRYPKDMLLVNPNRGFGWHQDTVGHGAV